MKTILIKLVPHNGQKVLINKLQAPRVKPADPNLHNYHHYNQTKAF